jgi:hypothetical protein
MRERVEREWSAKKKKKEKRGRVPIRRDPKQVMIEVVFSRSFPPLPCIPFKSQSP